MKRVVLFAVIVCAWSINSFGQGVVSIGAAAGKLKFTTDGSTLISAPTGNPDNVPGFGAYHLAIYSASNGTALSTAGTSLYLGAIPDLTGPWKIQSSALIQNINPLAGALTTTTVTLDSTVGPPNSVEQLEVVGWTGSATTFGQALATPGTLVGWGGSLLILGGSAFSFSFATGDGVTSSPIVTTGAAAWNGLVLAPVPEPGTLLLGGLGAAGLVLFRRRK